VPILAHRKLLVYIFVGKKGQGVMNLSLVTQVYISTALSSYRKALLSRVAID
jgi:hypothetical protein